MSNKRFSPDVDKAIWDKLREAQDKGLLPTTAFLDQAADIGRKAAKQREILDKLRDTADRLPSPLLFSDYVRSLSSALGIPVAEVMEAIGCCALSERELDTPCQVSLTATRLVGLARNVVESMMTAGSLPRRSLDSLRIATLAAADGRVDYLRTKVQQEVDTVFRNGSESEKQRLIDCKERLDQHFRNGLE